jgi:hypothetical protein
VTTSSDQPGPGAFRLAERLRDLRESAPVQLTQSALGQAFGDAENPVSPAAVSTWENAGSGRVVPFARLDAYARLFCTPRSFEGAPHLLELSELTNDERRRFAELKDELAGLRSTAVSHHRVSSPETEHPMWQFSDGARITLVCSRLPESRRPPSSNPDYLDYVRWSDLADLDALIEIYGAIRASNPPNTPVQIMAAQDLRERDVATHLVLIGGMIWSGVLSSFANLFPVLVDVRDPGEETEAEKRAIVVVDPDNPNRSRREFKLKLDDSGRLVDDVGLFCRGKNPAAPRRTLTICGGITTRGVRGAARCFSDPEMREINERYVGRFSVDAAYCVVMRVPVINRDPVTPDLSKEENRLFEWPDADAKAE